jgi:5S rRNA maturation endonuclease (ribonuclease M5)
MTKLEILRKATSRHDVALMLGFKPQALAYILYKKTPDSKYQHFEIPKRSGGMRKISAPCAELMTLQKRLSDLLQDCIVEINKSRNIESALSHGFRRKHSIITNAKKHRKRRYVFNLDLENFFGTINFGRVRGFFISNRHFLLKPDVATILAQIACYDNALPQGSPCSPVISNLIAHPLDIRLANLAKKTGCTYSRYADDLTFSTNKPIFPPEIAVKINHELNQWEVGKSLGKVIKKADFSINASKTRMQYYISRQDVTGLVVNTKISVRSEYWRTARAMAHTLFKTGEFQLDKSKQENGTIEQLNGILNFIDSIDLYNKKLNQKTTDFRILNSRESVYRNFLVFKYFYAASMPLIICEGKTDNIYIKSAIKNLCNDFLMLAERDTNNKTQLKVKLFKYSDVTDRILSLAGGTGDIKNFISNYLKLINYKYYFTTVQKQPVIILIDNDDGATKIFSSIKTILKTKSNIDGSEPFYFIGDNLYVVAIPKLADKTAIEDFFEKSVLDMKISGKKFNKENHFDNKKEYGKHLFAEVIVKKNKDKINFDKFKQILERIEDAINDYNVRQGRGIIKAITAT